MLVSDLDGVTKLWVEVLEALESNTVDRYENAFWKVLDMGDDIYLLRLISQTGPVTNKLSNRTCRIVMNKLNKIIRCNILQMFAIDWIEDSLKTGQFEAMDIKEKNEHLDSLHLFS